MPRTERLVINGAGLYPRWPVMSGSTRNMEVKLLVRPAHRTHIARRCQRRTLQRYAGGIILVVHSFDDGYDKPGRHPSARSAEFVSPHFKPFASRGVLPRRYSTDCMKSGVYRMVTDVLVLRGSQPCCLYQHSKTGCRSRVGHDRQWMERYQPSRNTLTRFGPTSSILIQP